MTMALRYHATPRKTCFACCRPRSACLCDAIPSIDNRTDVLILQHQRERKHAFNSVRIVERALRRLEVLVGYTPDFCGLNLPLRKRAALLYPSADAKLLTDLSPAQRPRQLVLLDGTWHHVKTMFRDLPALQDLPHYRLPAVTPSRYRIRLEPHRHAMSTLEATVRALRLLEPETPGLERLLCAFDQMVERQLAHPNLKLHWRSRSRRRRTIQSLPNALSDRRANLVVAYGEAAPRDDNNRSPRLPVYWVAERLGTQTRFVCTIKPNRPLDDTFLAHLRLPPSMFEQAVSVSEFRRRWSAFVDTSETIAVYHKGTAELLDNAAAMDVPALVLKSVCANLDRRTYADLESLLADRGLRPGPTHLDGRAGDRLAQAIALVKHLRDQDSPGFGW